MEENTDLLMMKPVYSATSRPTRQTYLQTFLFLNATSVLLGIAISAYAIFYRSYIPRIGFEKEIHLQYGDGPHPYGMTSLNSELISRQPYDIFLSLHLPRSPPNLHRGNFMLSLALLSPNHNFTLSNHQQLGISLQKSPLTSLRDEDILFVSRRPALLTYTSRLISVSSRFLSLPLHILGLRSEAETLNIPMGESITFARGKKNIPDSTLIEIQAGQDIRIYNVLISFRARFSGLRWFMYNHRVASFILVTGLFWMLTLVFAAFAWIVLSIYAPDFSSSRIATIAEPDSGSIKTEGATDEETELSDTPNTSPSHDSQRVMKSPLKLKNEVDSDEDIIAGLLVKSENEEDEADYIGVRSRMTTDSGVGTSLNEDFGEVIGRKRPKVSTRASRNEVVLLVANRSASEVKLLVHVLTSSAISHNLLWMLIVVVTTSIDKLLHRTDK